MQKDTSMPLTAAKGADMPHTDRPYKSSCQYRRYCHTPRNIPPFPCALHRPLAALRTSIITFMRCRFGKETDAEQYRSV